MMSNNNLKSQEESQAKQDKAIAKQATYFALYALLEFIIKVPLHENGQTTNT
jgi:hypothetical protein